MSEGRQGKRQHEEEDDLATNKAPRQTKRNI